MNYPIWKTITIGYKTKKDLLKEMKTKDITISDYAQDMIDKIEFKEGILEEMDLVLCTPKDLGLTENYPTTEEIYTKAEEQGLEPCPPEVGVYLRLEYTDQELYTWIHIAMSPITDRHGYPDVFYLERRADSLWLFYRLAGPSGEWGLDRQFVFRLRKNDTSTLKTFLESDPVALSPFDPAGVSQEISINGVIYVKKDTVVSDDLTAMRSELMRLSSRITAYLKKGGK